MGFSVSKDCRQRRRIGRCAWGLAALLGGSGVLSGGHALTVFPTTTTTTTTTLTTAARCSRTRRLASDKDGGGDDDSNLLERARILREEAASLERKLRKDQPLRPAEAIPAPPMEVTDLGESTWIVSYRFSSQPKDDEKNNSNDDQTQGTTTLLPNYSGKVTLRLREDGYTDLVSPSEANKLVISKVWGWDEEYSQEDQQQYLLWSMDVRIPDSDPLLPGATERYYFQARIDREGSKGVIALRDGTVTVKKDVAEKTKGRWGLFQVGGILTQFRYVGDFVAKPAPMPPPESS